MHHAALCWVRGFHWGLEHYCVRLMHGVGFIKWFPCAPAMCLCCCAAEHACTTKYQSFGSWEVDCACALTSNMLTPITPPSLLVYCFPGLPCVLPVLLRGGAQRHPRMGQAAGGAAVSFHLRLHAPLTRLPGTVPYRLLYCLLYRLLYCLQHHVQHIVQPASRCVSCCSRVVSGRHCLHHCATSNVLHVRWPSVAASPHHPHVLSPLPTCLARTYHPANLPDTFCTNTPTTGHPRLPHRRPRQGQPQPVLQAGRAALQLPVPHPGDALQGVGTHGLVLN